MPLSRPLSLQPAATHIMLSSPLLPGTVLPAPANMLHLFPLRLLESSRVVSDWAQGTSQSSTETTSSRAKKRMPAAPLLLQSVLLLQSLQCLSI